MQKNIKYFRVILILFIGLFVITGCVGENEVEKQSDEDSKLATELKVDQKSEKEFTITIQNGKKGDSKRGSILLEEGEDISEEYSFHGTKQGTAYLIPKGKTKDDALMYDLLSGEGNSTAMEIPAGEYEIIVEVDDDSLTGTFTAKTVASEENQD